MHYKDKTFGELLIIAYEEVLDDVIDKKKLKELIKEESGSDVEETTKSSK